MNRFAILFLVTGAPFLALCLAWLGFATIATNPLGWFLLLTGLAYALGILIIVLFRRQRLWERRSGERILREERGDRSFWFIFVRHPAYAGYLMMALGISLGYTSLTCLITLLALLLPGLVYRIKVEEELLGECFGEAYHQYASKVKRLIPYLW